MSAPLSAAGRAAGFLALTAGGALLLQRWQGTPWDLAGAAVLGSLFVAELLLAGWSASSLRRLLQPGNASTGGDLLYGALVLGGLFPFLASGLSFGLDHAWGRLLHRLALPQYRVDLPAVLCLPPMFLLASLAQYAAHRLLHTRWLWPLHAVHHAAGEMTLLTNLRAHPIENTLRGMFAVIPGVLLGFPPAAVAGMASFSLMLTFWQHSNLPSPWPWAERWLVAGPRNHRIHHARAPQLRDRNFCNLPLLDRLFGTYAWTEAEPELGIDDARYAGHNALLEMIQVEWRWLRGLLGDGRGPTW